MRYRHLFSLVYFGALLAIELGVAATIAQRISNGLIAAAIIFALAMVGVSAWQYGERRLKETETIQSVIKDFLSESRGRFAAILVNVGYALYFFAILALAALLCKVLMLL